MKRNQFGTLQIGIILLTLATAVIHLALGIHNQFLMFILNGIGYLVLVIALYLPQLKSYRPIIRWAFIAYTAVTIIAWAVIGSRNAIGYFDKAIEVVLIVLLFLESRQS